MKKLIRGKIVNIVDEYTVILNLSEKDGVEVDMIFIVYEEGEEVTDSEGKSLGKIEYPKATVKIINVSSEFSVAESDQWYYDIPSASDFLDEYDPIAQYKRRVKIVDLSKKRGTEKKEKTKSEKPLSERIKEKRRENYVNIGDLVKSKTPVNNYT